MRIKNLVLGLFLPLILSACSPAITGVTGNSLTRNNFPSATITANEPLQLLGYGRQFVTLRSDILTLRPTGIFDYAVFSDSKEGPVTRSAHSIMLRPTDQNQWRFVLESWRGPNTFFMRGTGFDGMNWTEQLMSVTSQGDWFSDMWVASGREVPERWLAKRFSATPADFVRMVAEYREPWPDCMAPDIRSLELVSNADECLGPFLKRADTAFSIQRAALDTSVPPAGPSVLTLPPTAPNATRLAGEVEERDMGFRGGFRRF